MNQEAPGRPVVATLHSMTDGIDPRSSRLVSSLYEIDDVVGELFGAATARPVKPAQVQKLTRALRKQLDELDKAVEAK